MQISTTEKLEVGGKIEKIPYDFTEDDRDFAVLFSCIVFSFVSFHLLMVIQRQSNDIYFVNSQNKEVHIVTKCKSHLCFHWEFPFLLSLRLLWQY